MESVVSRDSQSIQYSSGTVERAERAVRCSPFALHLFTTMREASVPLAAVVGKAGVEKGYSRSPLPELRVENHLLWLIQVGVLRREVDGQGITDSFRLTPLGRRLTEKWQSLGEGIPAPSWRDRLYNTISRWLRLF